MDKNSVGFLPKNGTDFSVSKSALDSKSVLEKFGLEFRQVDYYLEIGTINKVQGWILHLSVIRTQFISLLETIIPILIELKVPFKIARDKEIAKYLLDGSLGYSQIGKVVAIYPDNDQEAVILAQKLIALTQNYRGPSIPTDNCLGGIVYTRYGSFNPIIDHDAHGNIERKIYNYNGQLIKDKYSVPFKLPQGIVWPFNEITSPEPPGTRKLWNNSYKPQIVLKPDAKGRVIKGIYFKGFLNIKPCLIKEGKYKMWSDSFGRDIQDRLLWQYELYKELGNNFPTPKIFDLFRENNDLYLVMEFIKGVSIESKVTSLYEDSNWDQLPYQKKLALILLLTDIIAIIEKLHGQGYVHRDITPANFLVDKKGRIFLIDMELAFSLRNTNPYPPFKLGTVGYMSPQQLKGLHPTIEEDIYGLGALMIFFFTGLPPAKFGIRHNDKLTFNLSFFIKNQQLVEIISNSLQKKIIKRPSLQTIKETIIKIREDIQTYPTLKTSNSSQCKPDSEEIKDLINKSLAGLNSPELMTPDNLWTSLTTRKDPFIGNAQLERDYSIGFYAGMSGIVYLIAKAKGLGYNIDNCMAGFSAYWKYLEGCYSNSSSIIPPGLFEGSAGIAMAVQESLTNDLLIADEPTISFLEQCFEKTSSSIDIASGISGQCASLIKCSRWLRNEFTKPILDNYITTLISKQSNNGYWDIFHNDGKRLKDSTGFSSGIAGITYLLLTYSFHNKEANITEYITKSLKWLSSKILKTVFNKRKKNEPVYINATTALPFIKAYQLSNDSSYKGVAETILLSYPKYLVQHDFSQSKGIAKIGEIYLEAFKVFKHQEWKERADWIASLYLHTFFHESENSGHWSMNSSSTYSADLMTGNCGIIHFLMRYLEFSTVDHPIF